MALFKKICLPVDGSEHSNHACAYAVEVAKESGAEVVLVHSFGFIPTLLGGDAAKSVREEMKGISAKILAPYKKTLDDEGVKHTERVEEGHADEVISCAVNEEGCDVIIIGSRGLSDLEGVFVGSVTHKVLEKACCPVLVTRSDFKACFM